MRYNHMNRNKHLRHKPIIIEKKMEIGIGVLCLCPKCKLVLNTEQRKCECGCNIRWQ